MILTSLAITGGVVATSVKVYRDKKREREFPWTVAAERLARKEKRKKRRLRSARTKRRLEMASAKGVWDQVALPSINTLFPTPLFFGAPRHEAVKELSSGVDENEVSVKRMSKIDRDLIISSVSLGLATAGGLFYSPLSLLSVPGLLWITIVNGEDAVRGFKEGRGISVYTLSVLFSSGTILTGAYFAGNLGAFFVRFSKKLLVKTEDNSIKSLINVFGDQARFVWLLKDGIEIETEVESLIPCDIIVVHAGETIPVDGQITFGTAAIDQRMLTGESQPVHKEAGDQVLASTVVLSGKILIEVEKAGEDTLAAQIGQILNQTKEFKNEMLSWGQGIADRSARTTIALAALVLPFLGAATAVTVSNASFGIYMMALGPISMLSFLNLAGHAGILVKDGRSLQLLTEIDTVVFDKTGTLTKDVPHVGQIYTLSGYSSDQLLTVAAAAEYKQTHPIALAIREAASSRELPLPEISSAHVEIGYGLKVSIANEPQSPLVLGVCGRDTNLIRVGSGRFMELEGINIPPEIQKVAEMCQENGYSLVYVAINSKLAGAIELHATIRPEAREVINELRGRKMDMVIISGDHEQPTRKLAQELGIDNYFAETLPENKANLIAKLQEEGKSVCFVGDGINDSIALKKANVSVSLRGASSAATDAAQIVLMNQNLRQLIAAFDVAQNYKKNMKFNIVTTTLPGVITLFGAFFLGFGIVHSVVLNAMSLTVGAVNAIWPYARESACRHLH